MAKGANQKIKILYLMKILLENTDDEHGMTLSELTEALHGYGVDAERKTLYDDLEVLRTFGIDIEMRKDRCVRYYVASRGFEMPELKLLVDVVQSSKFITLKKSNELIAKLESYASRYQAQKLRRQVFVSHRIKTMNESIYYAVDDIHEAIGRHAKISFQYFEWNEKKEKQLRHGGKVYEVSPFALTWDYENYYLIAYDGESGRIKHYRVDKMLRLRVLDQPREGEALFSDFDVGLYAKKTFGMYGGEECTVVLRCRNGLAGIIVDRFGTDTVFLRADDSHFDVHVRVAISPLFLSWVMNFGSDIRILSPDSVKEQCLKLARDVIAQYENAISWGTF